MKLIKDMFGTHLDIRFARRVTLGWGCGVPGCSHRIWLFAFIHALIRRPWNLRAKR